MLRLLSILLWIIPLQALAEKTLNLNVGNKGFPPYTILAPGLEPRGLMVDVVKAIAGKHGYTVKMSMIPRKRVDDMILEGSLDATPRAKEWTTEPERFLFSDPVIRVREFVYSPKRAPLRFDAVDSLINKRIGLAADYQYPLLQPLIDSGKIVRVNGDLEESILGMLKNGRSDAAIVSELPALWTIKSAGMEGEFVYARKEFSGYDYCLMFNKKWAPFVATFNKELAKMKKDGRLEKMVRQYRSEMPEEIR